MDRYKQTEQRLRDIYIEMGYLEHLKKALEILEYEYGAKGISYDGIGGSSGISDDTGSLATRLADKKVELNIAIMKMEHKIKYLQETVDRLTPDEATVIRAYYIKNYPIYKIAAEMMASTATVNRLKARAMNRLIRGLYGEDR